MALDTDMSHSMHHEPSILLLGRLTLLLKLIKTDLKPCDIGIAKCLS